MKTSLWDQIVGRLNNFADFLEGKEVISERLTRLTPYEPGLVKKTRETLGASQAMFARFLGVKTTTVQSWELGLSTPSDMACRFMDEIRNNPAYWLERFRGALISKSNSK
jgi:putative transcriptional regulator